MGTQATEAAPIRKTVTVERRREDAFRVFTEGIGTWWPLGEYSLGREKAETAVLEPHKGGRIYERQVDGTQADWGTVLEWEPPARLVFSWGLNGSEIEVRFHVAGERTRVELEHRGWEKLEDEQERASYDSGWDVVLGSYVELAA